MPLERQLRFPRLFILYLGCEIVIGFFHVLFFQRSGFGWVRQTTPPVKSVNNYNFVYPPIVACVRFSEHISHPYHPPFR